MKRGGKGDVVSGACSFMCIMLDPMYGVLCSGVIVYGLMIHVVEWYGMIWYGMWCTVVCNGFMCAHRWMTLTTAS